MSDLRVVTFKIEEELLESVDMLARRKRMSRSEIIREALKEYLRRFAVAEARSVTYISLK